MIVVCSWLVSHGVNCGRTAEWIEMSLSKNFRRLQIFSRNFGAQSGPTVYIFVVPGGPRGFSLTSLMDDPA